METFPYYIILPKIKRLQKYAIIMIMGYIDYEIPGIYTISFMPIISLRSLRQSLNCSYARKNLLCFFTFLRTYPWPPQCL
jgi:hypothetical protein